MTTSNRFETLATEIGQLTDRKNEAYGDAANRSAAFLELLFPAGVPADRYHDVLLLVRIFDKMMRIANRKEAFGENPYRDIAGYGLLGAANDVPVAPPAPCVWCSEPAKSEPTPNRPVLCENCDGVYESIDADRKRNRAAVHASFVPVKKSTDEVEMCVGCDEFPVIGRNADGEWLCTACTALKNESHNAPRHETKNDTPSPSPPPDPAEPPVVIPPEPPVVIPPLDLAPVPVDGKFHQHETWDESQKKKVLRKHVTGHCAVCEAAPKTFEFSGVKIVSDPSVPNGVLQVSAAKSGHYHLDPLTGGLTEHPVPCAVCLNGAKA